MPRSASDILRLLVAGMSLAAISFLVLRLALPLPFIWILLAMLPVCGILALRAHAEWLRRILVVTFGLTIGLLVSEAAIVARDALTGDQIVVLVSELIPRAEWNAARIPMDGHPTSAANERLARALAGRMVPRASEPAGGSN